MVRREEPDCRSDPESSSGTNMPPADGATSQTSDRLSVPLAHGESDRRSRMLRGPHKMPSQDFFCVSLDLLDEAGYEILPATRGMALRDALQTLLVKRGIDINSVNVYLDSSNTPLDLQFETFRLGGNHLHVRARDTTDGGSQTPVSRTNSTGATTGSCRTPATRSNSSSSTSSKDERKERKISGSQRGRRNAMMLSTEDLASEAIASAAAAISQDGTLRMARSRPPTGKRAGLFSFRTDKEKMDELSELLNHYSQHGIPELPALLNFSTPNEAQEDPFHLEDHWSVIVENAETLTKRMRNQQDAIWELLQTEVFYIRRVKVITDLFLACLCNLQSDCILNEIDIEKMFSNISEIYATNHRFWTNHLLPMLEKSRSSRQPLDPVMMKDGFINFEQMFQPYVKYCIEQARCIQYIKERHKDNELFKAYVAWCETQKDCERLRLVDLSVKPMQRLTKYSLLLKAVHKKTDDEVTKQALLEMNECVENFVCGVDATLRQRHEQERLASIINRIESYDAIDCNNDELEKVLKEHCCLDLTCPMPGCGNQQSRQLLLDCPGLKFRDSSSGKIDVHCFLFTDMLLICKAVGKKGDKVRVIRQPFVVDRLVVSELKDGSGLLFIYLNEFKVATAAFVLYTQDTKFRLESIKKAQEQYKEAKAAAASERPELGFLRTLEEEEDYDFPSMALLVARSPRSSSRSSLAHSHSGSVDMSDPASTGSNVVIAPAPTPVIPVISPPPKNLSPLVRLISQPPSPRSLQRGTAINAKPPLLKTKNVSGLAIHSAPPSEGPSPVHSFDSDPLGSGIPTVSNEVPDLNVLDSDDENIRRVSAKRASRSDRRYHTADSIENLKKEKDTSIHKRLSWNYGQNHSVGNPSSSGPPGDRLVQNKHVSKCLSSESIYSSSGVSSTCSLHLSSCEYDPSKEEPDSAEGLLSEFPHHPLLVNGTPEESTESSPVPVLTDASNTTEALSSTESDVRLRTVGPPGSNIKIDVSEVKDGISSVQITVNGGPLSGSKPSKVELQRMKEILLTSCSVEASEV